MFVAGGQLLGRAVARARKEPPGDRGRYVPTVDERRFVLEPASRIAARHLRTTTAMSDTVDVCLIGVGVGQYGMRCLLDLEPLEPLDKERNP